MGRSFPFDREGRSKVGAKKSLERSKEDLDTARIKWSEAIDRRESFTSGHILEPFSSNSPQQRLICGSSSCILWNVTVCTFPNVLYGDRRFISVHINFTVCEHLEIYCSCYIRHALFTLPEQVEVSGGISEFLLQTLEPPWSLWIQRTKRHHVEKWHLAPWKDNDSPTDRSCPPQALY